MTIRHEDNQIQFDDNYRGWNPQILARDVEPEIYERFISELGGEENIEFCDLSDLVEAWHITLNSYGQ